MVTLLQFPVRPTVWLPVALMVLLAWTVTTASGQWPPDPETAGRGGAAGATGGILSPLRPAHLPVDGTWHVRLDHHVPFGVTEASTVGARFGRSNGQSTWLASTKATRFDAYQAVFFALSYMRPLTLAQGVRAGASFGWTHERMGLLGARRTPVSALGVNWHAREGTSVAFHLLNYRATRLHGWVVAADGTYDPGAHWPLLHATVSIHPDFGPAWHIGSTWKAVERMWIDIGGAGNPFRTAASIRFRSGTLFARFAFEWQPDPGISRWISIGWS